MFIRNAYKHFVTITRHRHRVIAHCFKAGIPWQGLLHDLSKYSITEFSAGVRFYQGFRSPNEEERETLGYSAAWMHHKGRNRHHFEYWTDYDPKTRINSPVEMPLRYVVEMFCDCVAASKIYNGENYTNEKPLEYFMRAKSRRVIHPRTSDLLEGLLRMLIERGEEETFAYLRWLVKQEKDGKLSHQR